MKSRYPKIEFDRLQMYFGDPYVIDLEGAEGALTIYQPTIGDIVRLGEKKFYGTLSVIISNTTSYRLPLWESGLDWNDVSDFQLFTMLYKSMDPEAEKLLFKDVDITEFGLFQKEDGTVILYDPALNIEINEDVYNHMAMYLRTVFAMFPEEKFTDDRVLKQWYINKDKRQLEIDKKKEEQGTAKSASILPLISSCVNHPGFKYNLEQLRDIGVCQFYDSVARLQIYENTTSLLKGMYSGMIDSSKIKPDDYNFMKDIS